MRLPAFIKSLKPQTFFLVAAIVFGIIYNLVTPPLQAPDEQDHFRRAYHVSTGSFLPQAKGKRLGGEIPVDFQIFAVPYRYAATNLKYTVNRQVLKHSFEMPFNESKKQFDDFPNTSLYSPVSYIPSALGLLIIRPFDVSAAATYYFARIFTFLVWIIVMYHLIKIIPVAKWLFTFICLLPMHLYMSNSFSADTMTNILALTFIVYVFKYAFATSELKIKQLLFLLAVAVLVALAKVVYAGLILSLFIIPIKKFGSVKRFAIYSSVLLGATFTVATLWSIGVSKYFTSYLTYDPAFRDFCCLSPCADYAAQKAYILNHGFYFFKVIYHSIFDHPYTYLTGYIGAFGNSDIPLPKWILGISYATIFFVALTEKNSFKLSLKQKTILSASAFFSFCLLLLSQHLTWDCVGEGVVDVVQGRYLIPLFPLLFLGMTGFFPQIKFFRPLSIVLIVCFINVLSLKLIYNRYFAEFYIEKTEFTCGAEESDGKGFFKTSNPSVVLDNFICRNENIARTGKASIVLSEQFPYGFTYRFRNLCAGDLIELSGWQKGSGAQLVISGRGKKCGEFFHAGKTISGYDENGWCKIELAFTMGHNCELSDSTDVVFFVWNPEKTITYVDDIGVSIKKFRKD